MSNAIQEIEAIEKKRYRCPACKSSRFILIEDPDFDTDDIREITLVIKCKACGDEEVRHYPR